jgi:hypothetical protein
MKQASGALIARMKSTESHAALLSDARRFTFTFAWVLAGTLLALDAERDGDEAATEIARRWILQGEGGVGEFVYRDIAKPYGTPESPRGSDQHAQLDCKIAWGVELPAGRLFGHRSLSGNSKL